MLEKPDFPDEKIIDCLRSEYGLQVESISFLPLGADQNTAVYQARTHHGAAYFVKLRRGNFHKATVAIPKYLSDLGLPQVIAPLTTQTGHLWANLPPFNVILSPYIEGQNGFERPLSPQQWIEFGAALKKFHTAKIPSAITLGIPSENFSPRWRELVQHFLDRIAKETFEDPAAQELAAFLNTQREKMLDLLKRTERYAHTLQEHPLKYILCHADIHGWNLLLDRQGALYMVDWDTLIFAPKERDLMFIGGGLGDSGYTPQEEETLFYQGYGHTTIHPLAIAYYRSERIIEDIAVYCEQIFLSDAGGEDRKEAVENVKSNFLPNGTLARAIQAEKG